MGSSFSNLLVALLAAQPLQVALPETSNQAGTGIVNSEQHLVVCDSSFNLPTPPCSWIRIAFMGALSPLLVFKLWCTLRSTHC
jgi:hypothetical protein